MQCYRVLGKVSRKKAAPGPHFLVDGGRNDAGDNGDYKKVVLQKLLITTRDGKVDDGKDDDDFDVYHGDGHQMVVVINYDRDDDDDGDDYKK